MKNRQLVIIIAALIVVLLFDFGMTLSKYPISRKQLFESPASAIVQAIADYEPEAAAQDIKILAQCGNEKESVIIFEYKGQPMQAIAIGKLAGLRYDLLVNDLSNSGSAAGGQEYNPALPANFLLHGYFCEQSYAYLDGQCTLTKSTLVLHQDIVRSLLTFLITFTIVLLINWYKKSKD